MVRRESPVRCVVNDSALGSGFLNFPKRHRSSHLAEIVNLEAAFGKTCISPTRPAKMELEFHCFTNPWQSGNETSIIGPGRSILLNCVNKKKKIMTSSGTSSLLYYFSFFPLFLNRFSSVASSPSVCPAGAAFCLCTFFFERCFVKPP